VHIVYFVYLLSLLSLLSMFVYNLSSDNDYLQMIDHATILLFCKVVVDTYIMKLNPDVSFNRSLSF